MKFLKYGLLALFLILVGTTLHYFLPSRDIVQIVGTDVKRMDINDGNWFWDKPDAGTERKETRDVRFINSTRPNGKARVYRNEDTNWSFPPYFKFDSGDLNAQAQDLAKKDDTWVAVSHYGWRIKLFSIFPNAYSIKRVSGPDKFLIPWFNIVFLIILGLIVLRMWTWIGGLKKKHVDPITDKIGDEIDDVSKTIQSHGNEAKADLAQNRSKLRAFMRRWFGSSK